MHSLGAGIVIIAVSTLAAIIGLILVRKRYDLNVLKSQHEVGGYMLSILGTLYAVVLGFIVVSVSESAQAAKENMALEVNSLLNIGRYADGLNVQDYNRIIKPCVEYCNAVAESEWPKMRHGKICHKSMVAMHDIWEAIRDCHPNNEKEQTFYSAIIDNYTSMSNGRRSRLIAAMGSVPIITWVVLIVGAIITIGFTYFFGMEKLGAQILMTSLVSITLSLNLYIVIVNSQPFGGDFGLSPAPFRIAAEVLKAGRQVPEFNDLSKFR